MAKKNKKKGKKTNKGTDKKQTKEAVPNDVVVIDDYPHFRKYKKSGHPALIVGEHSQEEYLYRKVMHNTHDGRHLNEEVNPNPDKSDPKPMYIAKKKRHDKKTLFGRRLPWKYPKK